MSTFDPLDVILAVTLAMATLLVALIFNIEASPGLVKADPTPVVIHDPATKPISSLKVVELRKLARERGVGTSLIRQSGRRADLLQVLLHAGVTCA